MGLRRCPLSSPGKDVRGLPAVLDEAGYHTATFHANAVSFWNRQDMCRSLGFAQYFDTDYFGTEDTISYGTSDEIFYKKTVEKLGKLSNNGSRFFGHLISLSSHFPFNLPDNKKRFAIGLPDEYNGSIVGSYIEAVSYADYAFGKFVEELKSQGLYEETMIAVNRDHQGLQTKNKTDQKLVEKLVVREYHPVLDHLNVPLVLRVPGLSNGQVVETAGGLVDIYPTLINLLGLDVSKETVFGTDLLNTDQNVIGIRFYAPTGTYVNNNYAFAPGEAKDSGQITKMESRAKAPADDVPYRSWKRSRSI